MCVCVCVCVDLNVICGFCDFSVRVFQPQHCHTRELHRVGSRSLLKMYFFETLILTLSLSLSDLCVISVRVLMVMEIYRWRRTYASSPRRV